MLTTKQLAEITEFDLTRLQIANLKNDSKQYTDKQILEYITHAMNSAGLRKQFFDRHLGKMVDFKY